MYARCPSDQRKINYKLQSPRYHRDLEIKQEGIKGK